jgi:geranylgeranyl reductase family protein
VTRKEILENNMIYDIIIVGAGPAGCKVGELTAKKGLNVLILEEHPEIGIPVHCSGLVSHRIFKLSKVSRKVIVNRVRKAKFYCSNNCMELKSKKNVYVINREKFDKELAKKAESSGAEIITRTTFLDYKRDKILKVKTDKGNYKTKLLVGADGPNSTVAKTARLRLPDNKLVGVQATLKSDYNTDAVELWFDHKISPEFFGWIIPENENFARVGLATKKNVAKCLDNFFLKRFNRKIECKKIMAGVIRYGLIENSVSNNVLLVGDAASQLKPFSGGGIIYGLISAEIAAQACVKSLKEEKYDGNFLKENYDDLWKRKLAWPIKKGLIMSKIIHSFSEGQLSLLFSMSNKTRIRKLLEFTDMDLL